MFRITIYEGNAAFVDNPSELADILRHVAELADNHSILDMVPVYDSNGNRVGLIDHAPSGCFSDCCMCHQPGRPEPIHPYRPDLAPQS